MSGAWRWPINVSSSQEEEYRWREVQFGDGYKQVVPDGINYQENTWTIRSIIPRSEAMDAVQVLRDHSKGETLDLVDPLSGEIFQGRVRRWRLTYPNKVQVQFDFEFERAYK